MTHLCDALTIYMRLLHIILQSIPGFSGYFAGAMGAGRSNASASGGGMACVWVQQSKDVIVEVDRWASHARLLGKSKPIG